MTCLNCERLQREVERLTREVSVRRATGEIGAVMNALGVTPLQARLLLRLYAAGGGGTFARAELMDELSAEDAVNVRVHVHNLRKVLGEESILCARNVGYSLSVPMMSRIMAALEPPILQPVRP